MQRILLPTRRPFDWLLYRSLLLVNVPAVFALIPFALHVQSAYGGSRPSAPPSWPLLVIDRVVVLLLIVVLARVGLELSLRIGVGLPFLERWIRGERPPVPFRGVFAMAVLVGICCAALLVTLELAVFAPRMLRMFQEVGIEAPRNVAGSPLAGLLAAVSAGVTEETLFRLFGLGLLAWLGGLGFHTPDGRPHTAVFWTANVLIALGFGAAHLSDAHALGWPMNAMVLTRTLLLNGMAGMAFGWLFWTWGLESAILAHFFTDVGLYTLVPIIALQKDPLATAVAAIGVGFAVVAAVIWSAWTLAGGGSRAKRVEAGGAG